MGTSGQEWAGRGRGQSPWAQCLRLCPVALETSLLLLLQFPAGASAAPSAAGSQTRGGAHHSPLTTDSAEMFPAAGAAVWRAPEGRVLPPLPAAPAPEPACHRPGPPNREPSHRSPPLRCGCQVFCPSSEALHPGRSLADPEAHFCGHPRVDSPWSLSP